MKIWFKALLFLVSAHLSGWSPTPYSSIETHFGKSIGVDEGYSVLDSMVAFTDDNFLGFFDGRWYHFNQGSNGASVGVGVRGFSGDFIWGINAYNDWRHYHGNDFYQIGLGLEAVYQCWQVSVNGYWPTEEKKKRSESFQEFSGGYFFETDEVDYLTKWGSLIVSRDVFCYGECFNLNIGVGPYYVWDKKEQGFGGLGRAVVNITDMFWLGGTFSYDPIYHSRGEVFVGFEIPLYKCFEECLSSVCECLYFAPPQRNGIIAIKERRHCRFNW